MCIICSLGHGETMQANVEKASEFLNDFDRASYSIRRAAKSMLECSERAIKRLNRAKALQIHAQENG